MKLQTSLTIRLFITAALLSIAAFGCAPHADTNQPSASPQSNNMPTQPRIPPAVLEMQKEKAKGN